MLYSAAIPKDSFHRLLADLARAGWRVVAPVDTGGRVQFAPIAAPEQALLEDELPYMSPKEYLFPMQEPILRFDARGEATSDINAPKTAIFNVKPCDLYALELQRRVFAEGKYPDAPYLAHRDNTVLIGQSCATPKPGCFCQERGISPEDSAYADIFLHDDGERWLADVHTPAGAALLDEFLPGLEQLPPRETETAPPPETLALHGEEKELFETVNWQRVSETCLGCGACTYVCPACHCFAFRDVEDHDGAVRYRCWDSCMYSQFTRHASGHNPRPNLAERYRQRVLHKFLYLPQNVGLAGCSGCGRCVRSCPAGVSIRGVVRKIMEELP